MHTARDDSLLGTMRFVSRHVDTQVYGAILPKAMTNQALLDSVAYKTYHAIASGKKYAKVKKVATANPKPTKKKAPVKADRGKGDGTDFESGVPDEQHLKATGADEGTGTIPGVLEVPKYNSESEKEYWGDSGEEDEDDEIDYEDKSDDGDDDDDGNYGNDGNDDDDDDANDDDSQEGDETNDDDEETNSDRTKSDIINTPVLSQSSTEYYKEEEKISDEETMDDEEDDEVTKEFYKDVNVNLGNEDTEMTDADQGGSKPQNVSQKSRFEQVEEDAHVTLTSVLNTHKANEPVQSSFVSSDFTSKLLNLENPSPADNEIASLMETSSRHAMAVPEITSDFTTTIPPPHPFFNHLPQQVTPTTSEATTSFPSLLDFSYVFKFNDRVTNLEKDLLEINQVDQYAQALFPILAIVDRCIDNKLGEAINKAIQAHNLDCRQEAQDEKNEYIGIVDTSMRTIIKEEVTTQLPQILPQAVYDFATPMIEKNVTKSLESAVLKRDSRSKEKKSSSTSKDASHSQQKPSGKRIVIQRRVEDLQLGVESYQNKLNLTKPDIFRSNIRNMTTYTAYSDPKGVIYKDQNNRNRLMHIDELHKFSDGTLNDVRTALYDIAKGIRMEYLPKRKWTGLDK
ncbi:hypothetical protein Tco_0256491 [Tanacetum coccineum]